MLKLFFFCQFVSEIFCPDDKCHLRHGSLKCHDLQKKKKKRIETLLRSFNMCQARQLLHNTVDLILHKVRVKYKKKNLDFEERYMYSTSSLNTTELV